MIFLIVEKKHNKTHKLKHECATRLSPESCQVAMPLNAHKRRNVCTYEVIGEKQSKTNQRLLKRSSFKLYSLVVIPYRAHSSILSALLLTHVQKPNKSVHSSQIQTSFYLVFSMHSKSLVQAVVHGLSITEMLYTQ